MHNPFRTACKYSLETSKHKYMLLFIGGLGMSEILLIVLVVLLFFGGKKIPEMMKGLGKGVRSFKEGMNEIEKDVKEIKKEPSDKEEEK